MKESIKPAALVETPTPAPVVRKNFSGGLEPGQLRGRVTMLGAAPPEDEGEAIIRLVTAMDGEAMRKWMRIKGNSDKLAAAYAKRNQ